MFYFTIITNLLYPLSVYLVFSGYYINFIVDVVLFHQIFTKKIRTEM